MDLSTILGWLSGNTGGPSTPVYPPGVSLNRPQGGGYPNGLAPSGIPQAPPAPPIAAAPAVVAAKGGPGATPRMPSQEQLAGLPPEWQQWLQSRPTTFGNGEMIAWMQQRPQVPGNQRIPTPTARPGDLNIMNIMRSMMGPSAPPSQEGTMYAPSQGPGAAVTQAAPDARTPLTAAMRAPPGAGAGAASAPQAPAPPGPNRMAPGAINALVGGQNPLAQGAQTPPAMALLSKLLGGR